MKKIGLLGSAPSSLNLAPFASQEWEFWGCSPGAYVHGSRARAWFELHRYEPGQPWFSEGYCKFLENFPGPVYMAEPVPQIKNCVVIPVDALVAKYSPYFFNSTLSWMFALAIEEKPKTIGLWGVDMAAEEEYYSQKMGCIWFAQIAQSLGIEIGVAPESDLFTPPPLYGVCEVGHAFIKSTQRQRELQARLTDAERRIKIAEEEKAFLRGAIDDNKYHQQTWHGNMSARGKEFVSPKHAPILETIKPQEIKPTLITPKKGNGKEPPQANAG